MNALPPQDHLVRLNQVVAAAHPKPGHGPLIAALGAALPELAVKLVYSRKGWHRPGGLVDAQGNRVAHNLSQWIEAEVGDDVIDLFVHYEASGFLATRLCGTTHYLTAKTGDDPWNFLQIEVNELREVADRPLFAPGHPPDTVEDLLDPIAPAKMDPTPLGPAFYELREAWDIGEAYARMSASSAAGSLLALRFFEDWRASSAGTRDLCKAFVLKLADYQDRFGEKRLQATPLSTHARTLPPFPDGAERGVALAKFLAAFDRAVGYPMAWYFHLVCGAEPRLEGVARAVFEDVSGAYDYLPERDVQVLKGWIAAPYGF